MTQEVYGYKMDNSIRLFSTPEKAIEYSMPRENNPIEAEAFILDSGTRILLKNCTEEYLVTRLLKDGVIVVYHPKFNGSFFAIKTFGID